MYLIMKCEPLLDGYECDADRTPICLTEDWKTWYKKTKPEYLYEVYKYINNTFNLIKNYEN